MRWLVVFLLGMAAPTAAFALPPCPTPNPNNTAPPFVDGCPLPAAPLNNLAGITATNTANIATNTANITANTANIATNTADIVQLGKYCPNITAFGGSGDGVSDNIPAFNAATAALTPNVCISFPAGIYKFSAAATFTVPSGVHSISLRGAGADVSKLLWASTGNGLALTLSGSSTSFHVEGLSIVTSATLPGIGISVSQTGSIPNPAASAGNSIINTTFAGASGYAMSDCWANAVQLNYVSNVNFYGDTFAGCANLTGNGINLIGIDNNHTGVSYNVNSSTFFNLDAAFIMGGFTQGLTISQSNITGVVNGVLVPIGSTTQSQLYMTNSQCGFASGACINDKSPNGVLGTTITGNFFIPTTNETAIHIVSSDVVNIQNNQFDGNSATNTTGIKIDGNLFVGGVISGNTFVTLATGINMGATTNGYRIANNVFNAVAAPHVSASPNIIITGTPVFIPTTGVVTGAANNGSNLERVTMSPSDTAKFVNGMLVQASGIGGTSAQNPLLSVIQIIDSTHVDLLNIFWGSSSYTSGGAIALMP